MASTVVSVPLNEERRNQCLKPGSCNDEENPDNTSTRGFSASNNVNGEEGNYQSQGEHVDGLSSVSKHPTLSLEIINTRVVGTTMSESENGKKDPVEAKIMLANGDTEKATSTGEGSGDIEDSRIPQTERQESGSEHFVIVRGSTYRDIGRHFFPHTQSSNNSIKARPCANFYEGHRRISGFTRLYARGIFEDK
jgi:hypothetical protein